MYKYIFFPIIPTLSLASCGNKEINGREDILVKVGSYSLTLTEVCDMLPGGMSFSDSATFVESYINSWVNSKLMYDVVMNNIDVAEEINQKGGKYREVLINDYWYLLNVTEYRENGVIMPYDFAKSQISEIFVE